jgi:hypothetical protein
MFLILYISTSDRQQLRFAGSAFLPGDHKRGTWTNVYKINNSHAYAGKLYSFIHLRALFVLHDRGILAHVTSIARHYTSN